MGIDSGLYLLGISNAIFVLMGIEDDKKGEGLFKFYLKLRNRKLEKFSLTEANAALDNLVMEIYSALLVKKKTN